MDDKNAYLAISALSNKAAITKYDLDKPPRGSNLLQHPRG